jgi:hypothetical protein
MEGGAVCCEAARGKTSWETQNKHRAGIAIILTRDLIVLVISIGASSVLASSDRVTL